VPVQQFLDRKLLPVLDQDEKAKLRNAQYEWPRYPTTIQELAEKHKLKVPWQTLPETPMRDSQRERWDSYRLRPLRPAAALANPALLKP
jgi:hypothetical protein